MEEWTPSLDWSRFQQGPVSAAMWSDFRRLVYESNLYRHYKACSAEARRMSRVKGISERDTRSSRKCWEREQRENDEKWHEAEFRAHSILLQIAALGSNSGQGTPDWDFSSALIGAVGSLQKQEQCDFSVTAIDQFDATVFFQAPGGYFHNRTV